MIPKDDLIIISGASVRTAESLWARVLQWMEVPGESTVRQTTSLSGEASGGASGGISLPGVGSLKAEGSGRASATTVTEQITRSAGGIDAVVREIGKSDFTVFIDDFHYMPRDTQAEVARQIKEAAERGVRICTASVPHRADDVVRSNPELRGRVIAIDFEYWTREETKQIALKGFPALGISIADEVVERFAQEAFGSPQLMQSMCLQTCFALGVDYSRVPTQHAGVDETMLQRILEHTATTTDFSSLLDALHAGPKLRGQDRNQFDFQDGSHGDVYRCVLLAIAKTPPLLSLRYEEIYQRTRAVCIGDRAPVGSSVNEALAQIEKIALELQPLSRVLEWSEDVLDIADPYFLYYLRCSSRLKKIQKLAQ